MSRMNIILGFFSNFLECNTILLDGDKLAFESLAKMLMVLEDPNAAPVHIHHLSFISPMGGIKLTALPIGKESGIRRSEKLHPHFTWELSEEGWLEVAEKILHLANSNNGHTWIESQGSDDALILASLGEYGQQWWNERIVGHELRPPHEF